MPLTPDESGSLREDAMAPLVADFVKKLRDLNEEQNEAHGVEIDSNYVVGLVLVAGGTTLLHASGLGLDRSVIHMCDLWAHIDALDAAERALLD